MRWTVLIPVKSLPGAKSRLARRGDDGRAHARLVEAIRADTIAAVLACPQVARAVLVTDRVPDRVPDRASARAVPRGTEVVVQRSPGLNGGLRDAAQEAARRWPDDGVAALVADLPALRAEELSQALRSAQMAGGFVRDHAGTGTTLLAAAPGTQLAPQFGPGSAHRHGATAPELPAGAGLRHDVDTPDDLERAVEIGVGPATRAALAPGIRPDDVTRSSDFGMMPS